MRQVVKRYGAGIRGCSAGVDALRGADLQVRSGELVGVVGAPGAGKSTLMLCSSGVMRPDSGTVSWFGRTGGMRSGECPIGYVPDIPMHYPFLTVREVLEHHAHLRALAPDERIVRVHQAMGLATLSRWAGTRIAALPAAVARRVAIAQELIAAPRLLVIDEPFAGVETAAQPSISEVLHAISHHGTTVLVASRDAQAMAGACTRVVVMSLGRVHGELDPARLRPADRVAESPRRARGTGAASESR